MPGGDGGDERRCDSGFVQSFRDEEPVVIAEAIVEGDESATQALYQPADGLASVLRLAGECRPGLIALLIIDGENQDRHADREV